MGLLAKGIVYNIHTIVGFSALFFMFLHAMSATYILRKNNTSYMKIYYRVSMVAWIFWIGSYFTGIMAHH